MQQIVHAVRKLAKTPSFTILSVLTLGLGIAATSAIFSVVNSVLLQPLPFSESERLVVATHSATGLDLNDIGISHDLYTLYRESCQGLEDIALWDSTAATLTGTGDPERLRAISVTPGFFEIVRVTPVRGRSFAEDEGRPGGDAVAILTDQLWQRRLGGADDAVGRTIEIDGTAREIVGVLPPDFDFFDRDTEIYLPEVVDPEQERLGSFGSGSVARLAAGVSAQAAETDLRRLIANLEEAFPEQRAAAILAQADFTVEVRPLRDEVVGDAEATLWILLGTVGLVLLIACANVANLFLVRAEGRQRETAVRTALGATRTQLTVGALAESLLLSLTAGVVGLGGAWFAVRALVRFGPEELPRIAEIGVDGRVVAFCAALSVLTGFVFGLVPAWRRIGDLSMVLKDGGRSATGGRGRHWARRLLVGAQVALALVLLVCSGLMVRSFLRLSAVDPGFETAGVATAQLSLPEASYEDDQTVASFYQRLLERVRSLPGVTSAGAMSTLPLGGNHSASGFILEDYPDGIDGLPPVISVNFISPGALETLGVRLLEGRLLELADQEERRGKVLISSSLARHYWPDESALGKRIARRQVSEEDPDPWYEVVGVVSDVRIQALTEEPEEVLYFPLLGKQENDRTSRNLTLAVRTESAPAALAGSLRQAVWDLDANLPIYRVRTLEEVLSQAKEGMAFTVILLLAAGAVSLLLGSVGTFGIISYLVTQRTSEIGVRMALGARQGDIRRLVLAEGMLLAGVGAVVGLAAAFAVTRWLESILFEIAPLDPLTFVAVPIFLLAVALVATWFPASRAARIAPVVALRYE